MGKAGFQGDLAQGQAPGKEERARALDPAAHDILMDRHAHADAELCLEMRDAQPGHAREFEQGEGAVKAALDVVEQSPSLPVRQAPCPQRLNAVAGGGQSDRQRRTEAFGKERIGGCIRLQLRLERPADMFEAHIAQLKARHELEALRIGHDIRQRPAHEGRVETHSQDGAGPVVLPFAADARRYDVGIAFGLEPTLDATIGAAERPHSRPEMQSDPVPGLARHAGFARRQPA